MSDNEYAPNARTVYLRELEEELAPEVWKCLAGLRVVPVPGGNR